MYLLFLILLVRDIGDEGLSPDLAITPRRTRAVVFQIMPTFSYARPQRRCRMIKQLQSHAFSGETLGYVQEIRFPAVALKLTE